MYQQCVKSGAGCSEWVSGVNVQECGAGGCAQDVPGRACRSDVGGGRRARRDAAVFS